LKKKKKKAKGSENFVDDLLAAINRVRANPSEFQYNIFDNIQHIRSEEGKLIFDAQGTKVAVVGGEEAFKASAAKMLNYQPCSALEFRDDLVINVPEDNKDWKNNTLITQLLASKKKEVAGRYAECAFNMDMGVSDPELSVLLQIVDDSPFKGKRRENILNPEHKYVGIHYVKQKHKFCCYMVFAK
jgi:hypothetical protein